MTTSVGRVNKLSTGLQQAKQMKSIVHLLTALPLTKAIPLAIALCNIAQPISAQSIVPAADGTNTVVTPNGNRSDIIPFHFKCDTDS